MSGQALQKNSTPVVLKTISELRAYVQSLRHKGGRVAFVPTMGALHEGHLHLVRKGLEHADHVIVSIFVNPTQFGPNEDFDKYPRTLQADLEKLESAGASAAFTPSVDEMYPKGAVTSVHVAGVSEGLCGAFRPGHFDGVATVVTKLLLQCLPDYALFGEKDYQQLQVIKSLTRDLNIPVEIIGVETVRDENGLALSSRNAYLSAEQKKTATKINKILFAMAGQIARGEDVHAIELFGHNALMEAGFDDVQYIEVREAEGLAKPLTLQKGTAYRVITAVKLGGARLIDNVGAFYG